MGMLEFSQNYLTRGFWGDEAWTSLISQLPYFQMLQTTARDFHPPAYYTVVELWYKIFPTTEVSTRVVSIIFYLLTVFLVHRLVYFIAREKKRFWGLISALVVLANPIFFTYAFEARNYTMFAFAATGSMYFLWKFSINSNNKLLAIFYILFTTLGIYTHYYMFFTLTAQGLYILLFDRKILLKIIGLYAIVGVLYLPWIPLLASQVSTVAQSYWIGAVDARTHYQAVLRILGGEGQNIFRPFLFGFSILLLVIGLTGHLRQKTFEKPYILIWLWAIVPFILASLPGLKIGEVQLPFRPIFFWRYLIGASVPLSMVSVHTVQKLPNLFLKISIALVILLSLAIDYLTLRRYPTTFAQVYENEIVGQIKPSDKIVTVLPSFAEVLYYRNQFELENDVIVLTEGIIAHSGKSLLDAYEDPPQISVRNLGTPEDKEALAKGVVYFELRPGPSVRRTE